MNYLRESHGNSNDLGYSNPDNQTHYPHTGDTRNVYSETHVYGNNDHGYDTTSHGYGQTELHVNTGDYNRYDNFHMFYETVGTCNVGMPEKTNTSVDAKVEFYDHNSYNEGYHVQAQSYGNNCYMSYDNVGVQNIETQEQVNDNDRAEHLRPEFVTTSPCDNSSSEMSQLENQNMGWYGDQ